MAKKDLRAQMDAARAAAAFIGAAQEEEVAREETVAPAGESSAPGVAPKAAAAVEDREKAKSLAITDEPAPAPSAKPKAARARKTRKKSAEVVPVPEAEEGAARMTAQVLVPMTAEQREHADLLASVMKITRAEVMRQALDEYWESHKSELQAAVAAYEELIKKLMK